ncbi:VWA domain-containing protein [Brevibacillus formosus]|uniref:vWA domain-containing protein n=1 Tax=Brevibacillus formosus TaxID=54913 RepID=UPI0018CCE4F3|nr:VWA domain-containing protein [Brevibacillus formosus]MBG9943259.1 magnesium chelatase [Brevibacillus formosus]
MRFVKGIFAAILLFSLLTACSQEAGNQPETPQTTDGQPPSVPSGTETQQPPDKTGETNTEMSREEKIKALEAMVKAGPLLKRETTEDFLNTPPGLFAGKSYDDNKEEIETELKKFPYIENPDEEIANLYYLALLGLFAESYPDPQQIINDMKMDYFGSPEIEDPRYQYKENYNVEIILDASGSMGAMANGKTRMDAAKDAIKAFAESLPPQANVALRVYGHKGSGKESDKALSCGSSDLVYGMQPYNKEKLQSSLNQFQPAGYTPIAYSLQEAMKDLSKFSGDKNTNMIYLVSDGIETCGGNPAEAAKQLSQSAITPIINVIGFGVDGPGQQQLKEVAKAAGGRYVLIQDQKELQEEFNRGKEIADKWKKWKADASYQAFDTRISRKTDISSFAADWRIIAGDESYNMNSAITTMGADDMIPDELANRLRTMKDEQKDIAKKKADELEDFLDSLNDKSYKETVNAINNKFAQNTKTN